MHSLGFLGDPYWWEGWGAEHRELHMPQRSFVAPGGEVDGKGLGENTSAAEALQVPELARQHRGWLPWRYV